MDKQQAKKLAYEIAANELTKANEVAVAYDYCGNDADAERVEKALQQIAAQLLRRSDKMGSRPKRLKRTTS